MILAAGMDVRKFFNTSKRQEAEREVDPTEKRQRLELTVAEECNRTDHSSTNSVDSASRVFLSTRLFNF